tara:strand:- start:24589 stop:27009 length:2421 start_codon:yes stop_codon:yes gene_type:complete
MLNEIEMVRYQSVVFKLSDSAKIYIRNTRDFEASRMVGKHARANLVSWRVSTKTNRTISLESRGPETAFFLLSEYDSRVIEIWDQPEPVTIERHNKNRKVTRNAYTPDFLVLTQDGPLVVEVKHAKDFDRLTKAYPLDWVRSAGGKAQFLPAERAFAEIGLRFEVFIYGAEMRYLIANTELMLLARSEAPACEKVRATVDKALTERFVWSLEDLRVRLGLTTFTPLVQLIDEGVLKANLHSDLMSEPEGCLVASTESLLRAGRAYLESENVSRDNHRTRASIDKVPTTRDAEHALRKLEAIKSGGRPRSVLRWRTLVAEGEREGLSPFQALLPKFYSCGNRARRIQKVVDDFLIDYLLGEHAKSPGLSKYRSYVRYRVLAAEVHSGSGPVSRKTFDLRLAQLPAELIARGRGGARAANAVAPPSDPEMRVLTSQLPWERAAIDHYLADIYLVFHSADGKVYVERPWISAMIDLRTNYTLAVTLSFLSPSKRAVSKVIRECVRQHGRLPNEIIVDRGSEFQSTYMASLMAHYGIAYTLRPSSHPRFGSQVERLFGEFKSQWLSQRPGNLAKYEEARCVDGKLAPRKRAVLFPAQAFRELREFCSWRDSRMRGGSSIAADADFRSRQSLYPFVAKKVDYDVEFMMVTAVDEKDFQIDQSRGLHIGNAWYYSPELATVRGKKSKVKVRIDPENPHIVYACIDRQWVTCYSTGANSYGAKSGPQQLAEGLVRLETASIRRTLQILDDESLCRVMRAYSVDAGSPEVPAAPSGALPAQEDPVSEEMAFDLEALLELTLDDLETESWSESYD